MASVSVGPLVQLLAKSVLDSIARQNYFQRSPNCFDLGLVRVHTGQRRNGQRHMDQDWAHSGLIIF